MSVLEVKNFINGEYVKAMVGDTDVPVYDPSTDTVFAHLPNSSKEDIDLAVNAAKVAFKRLETPPETPPETPLEQKMNLEFNFFSLLIFSLSLSRAATD